MRNHRHDGRLVEEAHGLLSQTGDVDQCLRIGVLVHQRVGDIQRAARRVDDVHRGRRLELRLYANHLVHYLQRVAIACVETGDEGIGLARLHHHHSEVVALIHLVTCLLQRVALALALLSEDLGIAMTAVVLRRMAQVHHLDTVKVQVEFVGELGDNLIVTQQDRIAQTFSLRLYGGTEHRGMSTLGKHHALRMSSCRCIELLRELRLLAKQHAQRVLILLPVLDVATSHTAFDGGLGNGSTHLRDQARVNRLRDEVVTAERQVVHLIDIVHHIGHRLFRQVGDGEGSSHLHLFVDSAGMHVESAAEDVWESNDVVDLVGIVRTARCHQHIGSAGHRVFVGDFGHGVRQRKHDGIVSHRAHHVLRHHITLRQTHEHIGAAHRLLQRVYIAAVGGEESLLLSQFLAVAGNDATRVEHHNVLPAGTKRTVELCTRNGGSAGTVHHNLHVGDVLARHLQRVLQSSSRDDGCAVLVVVHHGNIERLLQAFLYIETLRCLDVLEVDAAEGRSNAFHGLAELLRVFLIYLNIKHVDAAVDFEQQTLTLHHRLAAQRTDVAKSQHRRTIRDHSHEVALVRVLISCIAVALYLQTRIGHAGRIGQR